VSATTNHITTAGYSYDGNGNVTNDGSNAISYDAENRLVSSSGSLESGYATQGQDHAFWKVGQDSTTIISGGPSGSFMVPARSVICTCGKAWARLATTPKTTRPAECRRARILSPHLWECS